MIEPKEMAPTPEVEIRDLVTEKALQDALPDDDDDCLICYQTLYRPAKTECGHYACESCMLHWALTAMDVRSDHSNLPSNLAVDGIKFKCPTCRTYTQAKFDATRNSKLEARYPEDYSARASEENGINADPEDEFATQTMVLMFGNSHRKIPPSVNPETGRIRTHEWTFFVQSSHQNIIEKIEVILHPTFRTNRLVTLNKPPFSTTHIGWGYFTIFAGIQLKEGWQWVDESMAVDSARGRTKDRLPIQWLLDFRENGGQNNRLVKFKKIPKQVEAESDEEELDLGSLADLMSEAEIAQYRESQRHKRVARRAHEALERAQRAN